MFSEWKQNIHQIKKHTSICYEESLGHQVHKNPNFDRIFRNSYTFIDHPRYGTNPMNYCLALELFC